VGSLDRAGRIGRFNSGALIYNLGSLAGLVWSEIFSDRYNGLLG